VDDNRVEPLLPTDRTETSPKTTPALPQAGCESTIPRRSGRQQNTDPDLRRKARRIIVDHVRGSGMEQYYGK